MDGWIKSLIDAVKGSADLTAFTVIAVLAAWSLAHKQPFLVVMGLVAILSLAWLGMRYVLLHIRSKERLLKMRDDAKIGAGLLINKHATGEEKAELLKQHAKVKINDND